MTNYARRIPTVLLLLRVSIFVVMLAWTIDKFVRPEHAISIFEHFYFVKGVGSAVVYALAMLELLLLIGFVIGLVPRLTYGLVLLFHGATTFASYAQYFHPFEKANILFFASWPMLAACFALYYLRNLDTRGTLAGASRARAGKVTLRA
jgi:putative oxidoreductase